MCAHCADGLLGFDQVLGKKGIIEDIEGEKLWNALVDFTKTFKPDPTQPVPAINNKGELIESEIGPFDMRLANTKKPL